jgi:hypothetical protein
LAATTKVDVDSDMRAKYGPSDTIIHQCREIYEIHKMEPWVCLALCRAEPPPDSARREIRAENEPALETARLETAVRVGDLIE